MVEFCCLQIPGILLYSIIMYQTADESRNCSHGLLHQGFWIKRGVALLFEAVVLTPHATAGTRGARKALALLCLFREHTLALGPESSRCRRRPELQNSGGSSKAGHTTHPTISGPTTQPAISPFTASVHGPCKQPSKELIKPKAILERPTEAASANAAGAAAEECPGLGARVVGVNNHHCQICRPPSQFLQSGWSAMAQSWLTATPATQVQVIFLPQPPKQLGLQCLSLISTLFAVCALVILFQEMEVQLDYFPGNFTTMEHAMGVGENQQQHSCSAASRSSPGSLSTRCCYNQSSSIQIAHIPPYRPPRLRKNPTPPLSGRK
ncbi:uncharacterized protein LOC118150474 [Callithrix jacchus]|uniref:uncharacterized protein LOC118150474 n=1 Tax=Callithrix jacchus TaxID=9483 RepID=UPI0023DD01B2|nr:uncharacterized protein LOC118150474 [Callithrix jacchus]